MDTCMNLKRYYVSNFYYGWDMVLDPTVTVWIRYLTVVSFCDSLEKEVLNVYTLPSP